MNDSNTLLGNIKKNTGFLVDQDVDKLYIATISAINQILETEGTIDIESFGTFHRRSNNGATCTVFKASEQLNKHINK